jgi:hypothetical protein
LIFPQDLSLNFSRRRHLPYFKAFDTEYWPHQFLTFLWRARGWHLIEEKPYYAVYQIGDYRLKLLRIRDPHYNSPSYTSSLFKHFFDWKTQYKPPFPLKAKTVLDVGSGVGETALLFFTLGAEKVICVDINPQACQILRENADANGWDVDIINEPFSPRHLSESWDFCKIDIEGAEECLLSVDELPSKPIVLETHGVDVTNGFLERGFQIFTVLHREDRDISHTISRNYR